jgi:hypothetical protein
MASEAEELDALEDLVRTLESAPVGDRELDLRIEYCLGVAMNEHLDLAGMMIEEGFSWEHVSQALDCKVPPYSTSLDAALDDERVVFVMRSNKRDQWGAIHRAETGVETLAWAATEALARRGAALKARLEEGRRTQQAAQPAPRESAASTNPPIADFPDNTERFPSRSSFSMTDDDLEDAAGAASAIPETAKPLREAGDWKILF